MRKMSKECDIVRDLLPLYVDGACSEASAEMIKEHLENCPHCNELYRQMSSHTNEDILQEETESVIIRHEKKEGLRVIKYIFIAIAILYAPALLLVSLFADGDGTFISIPYSFILLVLFVYTVPFYFAFIEAGRLICSALDKRKTAAGEKVFNAIGAVLAAGLIIIGIVATAFDLDALINTALCLAGLLAFNWLISAIVYKKKPNLKSTLTDKNFWICAAVLLVVVALLVSISAVFTATRNVREVPIEVGYSIGYRDSGTDYEGLYFDIGIEEQHSWDVIGKNPTFTVKWVNETGNAVVYDMDCYIYKQIGDSWGICAMDNVNFSDETYTLAPGEIKTQKYSIDGYVIDESGLYKFVTIVEGKAVWVEFEVTIESNMIFE